MELYFITLFILICLAGVCYTRIDASPKSETSVYNPNRQGSKTANLLLPTTPKHDVAVVVALDGTTYLVEPTSRKILTSFTSGPSIYSSYQAFLNHDGDNQNASELENDFYIDIGDDWELYKHDSRSGKQKLALSAEDYVRTTPVVSQNGDVILGSKKTSAFIVDVTSGKAIRTFSSTDSTSMSGNQSAEEKPVLPGNDAEELKDFGAVDLETVEQQLYITRTDYALEGFSSKSGKVKWNVKFSEVEAFLQCPGSPLHCRTRVTVNRDRIFSESSMVFNRQGKLNNQAEDFKVQAGIPKKKKARKSRNKNGAGFEKRQKNISHENKVGETDGFKQFEINERNFMFPITNLVDGPVDGRRIGKLLVSNIEIAKGSNGTIVLEGTYDGRPVAVKRLVQTHHDVALREIRNLIASDQHPNIVRLYGVEIDQDFVYLSLERCTCSLNDLIYVYSPSQNETITKDQDSNFLNEHTVRLHSIMGNKKDLELWKANGYPAPQLLKLMRDIVSGLAHLHELGIIHRDLKPQNVLIIKERSLLAKLSDMGISKRLVGDSSSLTQHATGYGSSGWQAPEQLNRERQTLAVDLFSLGCVLFSCVTGGKHPFGDSLERDVNIVNNQKDLFLVENIPEAMDLFSHLLDPNPDLRPKALEVLHHPFFWSSEMRLSFLRDVSDRVELEDRENESELLKALESIATMAFKGKWNKKLESAFINNIGRYRRYKFDRVQDLLRVIRNKYNHYRDLPQEIRELLGQVPEGFDTYFSRRFPRLLIEVYKVIYRYCREEEFFCKYFKSNLI